MNILLIGGGGREHALAWKIVQSPLCSALFAAPGNPGIADFATCLPIKADDLSGIASCCIDHDIDLVVVGPEIPLVLGIRDFLEQQPGLENLKTVGPGILGAQLEGSKDFSKQFMNRHRIPTAEARTFTADQMPAALKHVATCNTPIVLKADGLAAGKGVIITDSREEAAKTLKEMMEDRIFGAAGARVLIEQFLSGIELSVFVLTDGRNSVLLPEAKDYKRIGDGDKGPNTGGMGAVSPVPFADDPFMDKVRSRIIEPTIRGLAEEQIPYRGFIFFGLINVGGDPYVIEYNARMGDPETQVVMTRLKSDLVPLLVACADGNMEGKSAEFHPYSAVTVSMVSAGYPGNYTKGAAIQLNTSEEHRLFHAGTSVKNGLLVTDGGRVISATGTGPDLEAARSSAYAAVSSVSWDGVYFRTDIGKDLINSPAGQP
ncbi:MAG: phosphoribosylamine--glycine ligase [Bacteroidota bacterium]